MTVGIREILSMLRAGQILTPSEISAKLGGRADQASLALRRLERQGYAERLGDGRWRAA